MTVGLGGRVPGHFHSEWNLASLGTGLGRAALKSGGRANQTLAEGASCVGLHARALNARKGLWMKPALWRPTGSRWRVSLTILHGYTLYDVWRSEIVSLRTLYAVFGSPQADIRFNGSFPVLRSP